MASQRSQQAAASGLHGLNLDVAFLTETNVTRSHLDSLHHHYPGSTWTAVKGKGHGIGVIPLNDQVTVTRLTPLPDRQGRTVLCAIRLPSGLTLNALVVYAPAKPSERTTWLREALVPQKIQVPVLHLLLGDFNCDVNDTSEEAKHIRGFAHWFGLSELLPKDSGNTFYQQGVPVSRIDTVFAHPSISTITSSVTNLGRSAHKSDHSQILFTIRDVAESVPVGSPLWRLRVTTAKHLDTLLNIDHNISEALARVNLTPAERWKYLKHLVRQTYMRAQSTIDQERNSLSSDIRASRNQPNSSHKYSKQQVLQIHSSLEQEQRARLSKWAGVSWDLYNELPSPVLTSMVRRRKEANMVYSIRNPDSKIVVTSSDAILDSFHSFYSSLYRSENDCPGTHAKLLQSWVVPPGAVPDSVGHSITAEEVLNAIKHTDPDKAPGPDGLTGWFYTLHAKRLAPLLADLFNDFLHGRTIPASMKRGVITTIFKGKGDALDIDNRRPITLLNIDYKLLSKVLNDRLRGVLDKLIHPRQAGFCPNRSIFSNILLLDMALERMNHDMSGAAILVDFLKAFDRISHGTIRRTLEHVGLPQHLVRLIMDMYSSSSSQVLVNGRLSQRFPVQRGTKQGDPLSPTIFVLCIECLSRALEASGMKGIAITPEHMFRALLFADDLLLLCHDDEDFALAWTILDQYCVATTSKVNTSKTKWLGIEIAGATAAGIQEGAFPAGERYLGITFNSHLLVDQLTQKIDEIEDLLHSIKHLNLSLLGKHNVLRTYALSKLTYFCYIHNLTDDHVRRLNNIVKWFLWSREPRCNGQYRARISLLRLQCSTPVGGIGLYNFEVRAAAQRATLWLRALHQHPQDLYAGPWIYFRKLSFYQWPKSLANAVSAMDAFLKFGRIEVGPYPTLRDLYSMYSRSLIFSPTSGQKAWEERFKCNWGHIWVTLHSSPCRSFPRAALFRFFHRDHFIPKHHETCFTHKVENDTIHTVFHCVIADLVVSAVKPVDALLTNSPLPWTPEAVLPLAFSGIELILQTLKLWLIFRTVHSLNFTGEGLSTSGIVSAYKKEISTTLSAILARRIACTTNTTLRKSPAELPQRISATVAKFMDEYNALGNLTLGPCNLILLD